MRMRAAGGLTQYAGAQDNVPLYAMPNAAPESGGVGNLSLAAIEAIKPLAGMARGGRMRRFAIGGIADAAQSGTGDPRIDPRTRAIKAVNDRIQQQGSLRSAQQSTMGIMGRMSVSDRYRPSLARLASPGASRYLSSVPFDTQIGYNDYPLPETRGYADGGQADDQSFVRRHPWIVGAAGAAASLANPRAVNTIARPFTRAMSRPALGIEAVSKEKLSPHVSDARYNFARSAAFSDLADRPVWKGQGAWQGDHGMEHNPLYVQELPRTLGKVKNDYDSMEYASQMGENLEQVATPVSRFVPHAWNTPEDANAMMFSKIDNARLKRLAELMGPDWVAAHRPGNKAMAFPLGEDKSLDRMAGRVQKEMPDASVRYGRSDPGTDRVLLSREPLGYEDGLYKDFGAIERAAPYDDWEKGALKNPRVRRGESFWNDLNLGAK